MFLISGIKDIAEGFYNAGVEVRKKVGAGANRWAANKRKEMSTRHYWLGKLPIIGWLSKYSTSFFMDDLIAGLTVGLTVIPQGMACAVIAGLPPQYGLYSAFMCCFVYMILGTSKDVTIGPTAVSAMLVRPYVIKFAPEVVTLVCFLSGCLITILSILQLGFVIDFISMPVLEGFVSAAAISIISSQVAPMLGIKGSGSTFIEYWRNVFENGHKAKLWDPIMCWVCIFTLLALKHVQTFSKCRGRSVSEKIWRGCLRYLGLGRNALVVLVATGIIAGIMSGGSKPPVAITGPVKEGIPEFRVPKFTVIHNNRTLNFDEAVTELSTAIIIPFVLVLEAVAIAKAFAKGRSVDSSKEMFAIGISNVVNGFVQSFPVTGSFTRSAVNNASGVKTPIGGMYTAAVVLLCLAFLTRYLQYMPKAALAAVIICAVTILIEIHEITPALWKSKKADLIPLYATFIGCLVLGIDIGIVIGIVVNLLFILYEAARPKMKVQNVKVMAREVLLVSPDRGITYPSTEYVKDVITQACDCAKDGILVVVDGSSIKYMDSTALKGLKSLLSDLVNRSQPVVFWNWNVKIIAMFVGFDNKGAEYFREAESLEQLIPKATSTNGHSNENEDTPPVP